MAIHVGYWEDAKPEHYAEGPFVICGPPIGNTTRRIEVHSPYAPSCVFIEPEIHRLIEAHHGIDWRSVWGHAAVVDWLNAQVKEGRIISQNGVYLPAELVSEPNATPHGYGINPS